MTFALNIKRVAIDRSGTITAGATSQTLAPANSGRGGLFIQNIDAAEDLWINEFGVAAALATAGSILIPAKSSYLVNTANLITVIATTTGHKYTATEW